MTDNKPNTSYDLTIIGSGPAGIYAALEAGKMGKKVAIVERNPKNIGGTWIHTGTLPSKTFREVLAAIRSVDSHVGSHWVNRLVNNLSTLRLQNRADDVSQDEEKLMHARLKDASVDIIRGSGFVESTHSIRVYDPEHGSQLLETDYILIATGSRPRRPENIPFDGWRVVDSDEILSLEQLPQSILVFGAGVIGCEYACIFRALGVDVTIVDARSRIMQTSDREIADELKRAMENVGVCFKLGYRMTSIDFDGPKVNTSFEQENIKSDLFFFAAGRESCSDRLGLERVGVHISERGMIQVNNYFQTNIANIYAAGDVIGPPALASTSTEQGRIAAAHAFGTKLSFPEVFPLGIYTIPEMSSVGRNEEELTEAAIPYIVGKAKYSEIARGYIRGDSYGLLKLIVCEKTRTILGVHIVGADACNLIHIGQCCMLMKMPIDTLVDDVIFNHPTLAEGYKIAASNALEEMARRQSKQSQKRRAKPAA